MILLPSLVTLGHTGGGWGGRGCVQGQSVNIIPLTWVRFSAILVHLWVGSRFAYFRRIFNSNVNTAYWWVENRLFWPNFSNFGVLMGRWFRFAHSKSGYEVVIWFSHNFIWPIWKSPAAHSTHAGWGWELPLPPPPFSPHSGEDISSHGHPYPTDLYVYRRIYPCSSVVSDPRLI